MATLSPTAGALGPPQDYLTRDYASFRRLLLERLMRALPDWREDNSADLGQVLVELLAYSADQLCYFQDAVANEAYLGTARRRLSVRRHVRLLDYAMHDGCNARAWVALRLDGRANGQILPKGSLLLSRVPGVPTLLSATDVVPLMSAGAQPFETLHDLQLFSAHGEIPFCNPDGSDVLPQGATGAILDDSGVLSLKVGDVLILEETKGPDSGQRADADPSHRQAVRLTRVEPRLDATRRLCTIAWASGDALRFDLRLSASRARGNVVLVDHGCTLPAGELLDPAAGDLLGDFPLLRFPLTQQGAVARYGAMVVFDPEDSASAALSYDLRDVRPAVTLRDDAGAVWSPRRDLLASSRFATDFVVEIADDGRAAVRFGDGIYGKRPGGKLTAQYRIGNGRAGNVGAEAIAHLVNSVGTGLAGICAVRNPLRAQGGTDPESVEQVRLYAAQAFRTQERAVTADDYAAMARRHPEVRDAQATRRYTGSFYTLMLTVQRRAGLLLDAGFKTQLRAFLDRYRMMGQDLQLTSPVYVPLDLQLVVQVAPGYYRNTVLQRLQRTLGLAAPSSPDQPLGFFHPDQLALGAPIYLSQLMGAVMQVPGVLLVKPGRFCRYGAATDLAKQALQDGVIALGRLELPRLDNDPSAPERGTLTLLLGGGR